MAEEVATTQATPVTAPVETPPATTQTETQPDKPVGGLENNGQVAKPVENASTSVPEKVAETKPEVFELKLSEGSLLRPERLGEIETFAKSHNLTAKQAQELVGREEATLKGYSEAARVQHQKQIEDWHKASSTDSEFGGEKLSASAEVAKRAMTKFGGERLAEILDQTGYGNHPEVIRTFYRIGQAMSEGRIIPGGASTGSTIPVEDKFYGKKK